jgi:hypothetical protein
MSENIEEGEGGEEEMTEESPDTSELIKKDISDLAILLSENPESEQQVREVFDYHLKEGVDRTTYETVRDGLEMLLGESVTNFIVRCCRSNDNRLFEHFKKDIGGADVDKVLPFLQHLAALYGSKMEEAYALFGEIPEDWKSSAITVYREEEEGEEEDIWFININLTKYSGEGIFLRMRPASAFILVKRVIKEMGKLPREAVDEEVIKAFREETDGFNRKFLSENDDRD